LSILPFRGEYYQLTPERRGLVRGLIYPVPDPRFPFLGVHLTLMVNGGVEAGPNAVLALKREGYRWRDVSLRDAAGIAAWPGFWRLAARFWRTGAYEVRRSLLKSVFVRDLQRLVPELLPADLRRAGSGLRSWIPRGDWWTTSTSCAATGPSTSSTPPRPPPPRRSASERRSPPWRWRRSGGISFSMRKLPYPLCGALSH
jgi:(S)-2-hydroxyglutarate dehydrogenase